jgi:hypothetical protein
MPGFVSETFVSDGLPTVILRPTLLIAPSMARTIDGTHECVPTIWLSRWRGENMGSVSGVSASVEKTLDAFHRQGAEYKGKADEHAERAKSASDGAAQFEKLAQTKGQAGIDAVRSTQWIDPRVSDVSPSSANATLFRSNFGSDKGHTSTPQVLERYAATCLLRESSGNWCYYECFEHHPRFVQKARAPGEPYCPATIQSHEGIEWR